MVLVLKEREREVKSLYAGRLGNSVMADECVSLLEVTHQKIPVLALLLFHGG